MLIHKGGKFKHFARIKKPASLFKLMLNKVWNTVLIWTVKEFWFVGKIASERSNPSADFIPTLLIHFRAYHLNNIASQD